MCSVGGGGVTSKGSYKKDTGASLRARTSGKKLLLDRIIEYYMKKYASPRVLCCVGHLIRKSIKRLLLGNFFLLLLRLDLPSSFTIFAIGWFRYVSQQLEYTSFQVI